MRETNYVRDVSLIFVGLALAVIVFTGFRNPDGHWLGVYYAAPASLVGVIALVTALFAGARRWWMLCTPILLLPIFPILVIVGACETWGECI